jgi:hypothetical protein
MLQFLNHWQATIQAPIGPTDTTWTIDNISPLPVLTANNYMVAAADNGSAWEIIHIVDVNVGSNQITVVRAMEETTALSYIAGNIIEQRNTKGIYDSFAQIETVLQLDNTETYTPTDSYHPATKEYVDTVAQGQTVFQYNLAYNSPDIFVLGETPSQGRVSRVIVNVIEAFDGGATLMIGDNTNTSRHATESEINLSEICNNYIHGYHYYPGVTNIRGAYTRNTATVGTAIIEIYYSLGV